MSARIKPRTQSLHVATDMCPVVGAIKSIVTESRLLVVRHLFTGPKRFNELLRVSGINSKTLSATLKFLEEREIVRREVLSTRPFTVEYSLTPSGQELQPVLDSLGSWGSKWLPEFKGKVTVHPLIRKP
ncbi:MAG: helix-turn-helix domain-containing protein [Candidatus Bathyarchaeia archaeon]